MLNFRYANADFFKTPHIQIRFLGKDPIFKYEFLALFIYPCRNCLLWKRLWNKTCLSGLLFLLSHVAPVKTFAFNRNLLTHNLSKLKAWASTLNMSQFYKFHFSSATTWDGECRICGRDCNRFKDFITFHKEMFGILQVKGEALELNIITEKGWCQ